MVNKTPRSELASMYLLITVSTSLRMGLFLCMSSETALGFTFCNKAFLTFSRDVVLMIVETLDRGISNFFAISLVLSPLSLRAMISFFTSRLSLFLTGFSLLFSAYSLLICKESTAFIIKQLYCFSTLSLVAKREGDENNDFDSMEHDLELEIVAYP